MRQKPSSFEGGSTAGEHPAVRRLELFVAPSIGDEGFNTIRLPLVVVACWRMNHALFDFGSSFVTPETKAELPLLARIVDAHPGCPAAIFGHADPTGDDEHNKHLSGRRARAIHALLTRDVGVWEDLFSTSTTGDSWGLPSTQRILMHLVRKDRGAPYLLGPATGRVDAPFDAAVRAFQVDQGLTSDGIAGPLTRKALYAAYMDDLCLGPERRFVLENEAFVVGDGAKDGKGAFQGCSEFNPVHLLSREELASVGKEERDGLNATNRRVMIFLFRRGTRVDRARWPCPVADAPAAGCHELFWPDAETRRSPGDNRREYRVDRRTMACRFYDRLARKSPCEGGGTATVRLRLFDTMANPLPGAIYKARGLGDGEDSAFEQSGRADRNAMVRLRDIAAPARLEVTWNRADAASDIEEGAEPPFLYTIILDVLPPGAPSGVKLKQQLNALGYPFEAELKECVTRFQRDYGLPVNGDAADPETISRVDALYHDMNPTPLSPPKSIYRSLLDNEVD